MPIGLKPQKLSLQISNNCQDFSSQPMEYTVTEAATVSSIEPSIGSTHGGSIVVVTGKNFVHSGATKCHFGDFVAGVEARFVNSTAFKCVVPAISRLSASVVNFRVSSLGAFLDDGNSNIQFEFMTSGAFVSSIKPNSGGLAGGTDVSVAVLNAVDDVVFCKFGDVVVAAYGSSAPNAVVCTSPVSSIESANAVPVEVSSNGVDFSSSNIVFSYVADVNLLSVSPASGPESGGTMLTLTITLSSWKITTQNIYFTSL